MNREELQQLLQRLQQGLADAPPMDAELRASLLRLDEDIRQALKPQGNDAAANEPEDGSLQERAQALETRFEAEHPTLAGTIRDLMDTLGKMGI
mgnify:CR=1 FL=1